MSDKIEPYGGDVMPAPGYWIGEWTSPSDGPELVIVRVGDPEHDSYPLRDRFLFIGSEVAERVSDPRMRFIKRFTIEDVLKQR